MSFVHLHQHTEYSLLDGASRVNEVVAAAARDGQPALAITDHGVMYGVPDFVSSCDRHGVKPIIGFEAYMAHEHRTERPTSHKHAVSGENETKQRFHLTLLAENETGYRNLVQMSSRAFLEGFYYKPRVDWEILGDHAEGVIATTGCLGGQVLQRLVHNDFAGAVTAATRLQDIFGRDNLFVELQNHGIPEQTRTNPELLRLAKHIGAPLVATNDCHYVHAHDAVAHDALLCVQTGSKLADTNRFRFHGDQHYLKTGMEMRGLFAEVESACDNTLWIAERCETKLRFGETHLPVFPLPDGVVDHREYLTSLVHEGAISRWGETLPETVADRLAYELQTIHTMGFDSYFLIVWDLIEHAKRSGISVGPGRGSAAGCAVAYALGITELDPIKYGLLFERFLNPERVSLPDIDLDFDSRYREDMIAYTAEKYGRDHVAQIVTFAQIKAKTAVRDAARVLGLPFQTGSLVAESVPGPVMGRTYRLETYLTKTGGTDEVWESAGPLRELVASNPDAARIVEVAKGLEGARRSDGIHAAAVVIAPGPITDYLPVQQKPDRKNPSPPIVTQYDMGWVEQLGLLKMDFLGLKTLDVIQETSRLIGEWFHISWISLEDPETFRLFRNGDTIGVFQMESAGIADLAKRLKPETFEDIGALVALYRPGPMGVNMHLDYADRKNGVKPVQYFHADAQTILEPTFGLMIYQESVMQVAQKFAGYTLGQADMLRKACGKKNRDIMAAERQRFVAGCIDTGYGESLGEHLFETIEHFADYAFNKSHSFAYGMISYQTAFLKANYPIEFFAALLTSVQNSKDRTLLYLLDAASRGIGCEPACVNRSFHGFTPETEHSVRFGLGAISGIGAAVSEPIISERTTNGPYTSFFDFCARVPTQVLATSTLEHLIKAGCFDFDGVPRTSLLAVAKETVGHYTKRRAEHSKGVISLFDNDTAKPVFDRIELPEVEQTEQAIQRFELDAYGVFVTSDPLQEHRLIVERSATITSAELTHRKHGTLCGVVIAVTTKTTRKGDQMAVLNIADLTGTAIVVVFPRQWAGMAVWVEPGVIVDIDVRVEHSDDEITVMCSHCVRTDLQPDPVTIRIPETVTGDQVDTLKQTLADHPGVRPVLLLVGDTRIQLPDKYSVKWSTEVSSHIHQIVA